MTSGLPAAGRGVAPDPLFPRKIEGLLENARPGLTRIGVLGIDDVLPHIHVGKQSVRKEDLSGLRVEFYGHSVLLVSIRLQCFKVKGLRCAACGLEGTHFALESTNKGERPHVNLYATRPSDGEEILMTRDHVMPSSLGGPNELYNSQTLCMPCNCAKGSRFDGKDRKIFRAQVRDPQRLANLEENKKKSLAETTGAANIDPAPPARMQ